MDEQGWFWTSEWQAGEADATADIAAGRVERFDDDESLLAALLAPVTASNRATVTRLTNLSPVTGDTPTG